MVDEDVIEPNEEITWFIGLNVNVAKNLLGDVGIDYRIWRRAVNDSVLPFTRGGYQPDRVNLYVDATDLITKVAYG